MAPVVDSAVFRRKPLRVLHQGPFGAWLQYDALTYDVLTFALFWAAGVAPEVRRALAEEMPAPVVSSHLRVAAVEFGKELCKGLDHR